MLGHLQRHQDTNSPQENSNADWLDTRSGVFGSLRRERVRVRRSGAVLALARDGLLVVAGSSDGPGRRGLRPSEHSPAGRNRQRAADVVQLRGPVVGVVARLVEFIGGIVEADALAVRGIEGAVTRSPGPVRERMVQIRQVVGEEDGPQVCAGEVGFGMRTDFPGTGTC